MSHVGLKCKESMYKWARADDSLTDHSLTWSDELQDTICTVRLQKHRCTQADTTNKSEHRECV